MAKNSIADTASKPQAKPYRVPKLQIYGAMSSLTAAGSRGEPEGTSSSKNKKA